MKNFSILFASALIIGACSSEPEKIHLRTEKGPRNENGKHVDANSMMTVEIQGMTCEMGCGGSIRKELKGTGAVARVQFDFEEGRKKQTAMVSYDSSKITAAEMIRLITTMNDKQFSVDKNTVEPISKDVTTDRSSSKESKEPEVELEETRIEMPNLINILKDLVVG